MTTKEYNEMMLKYRFDDYIRAQALKMANERMCLHYLNDIIQNGYLGLAAGLNNYNKGYGDNNENANTFVGYITTSINGYIMMFIDTSTRAVRIPKKVIYTKNREFDTTQRYDDITEFEQAEEINVSDLSDEDWLYEEAIRRAYEEIKNNNDKKVDKKIEAFKKFYRTDIPKQLTQTSRETGIHTTSIRKSNKEIIDTIKEKYDKLYNQRIRAQIKRNNVQQKHI